MLWHLLGWITFAWIVLTTIGVGFTIWLSLARPWAFRPRLHVPREVHGLEWETPAQDNPIPWI